MSVRCGFGTMRLILYVEYQTTGKWLMSETHLQIATALSDIPSNKNWQPYTWSFCYG